MAWRSNLSHLMRSWRGQKHNISLSTIAGMSSPVESADKKFTALGKKATPLILLGLTGAFALSAFDDFAIYYNCSSKAIEKATDNVRLREALGEPIRRGQWYNATLSVAHHKHSVSCTFPVVGAHGNGILQLKAVRHGENKWFTFPGSHEWEILLLEALVHTNAIEESKRTFRVNLMTDSNLPENKDCKDCNLSTSLHPKHDEDVQKKCS